MNKERIRFDFLFFILGLEIVVVGIQKLVEVFLVGGVGCIFLFVLVFWLVFFGLVRDICKQWMFGLRGVVCGYGRDYFRVELIGLQGDGFGDFYFISIVFGLLSFGLFLIFL